VYGDAAKLVKFEKKLSVKIENSLKMVRNKKISVCGVEGVGGEKSDIKHQDQLLDKF